MQNAEGAELSESSGMSGLMRRGKSPVFLIPALLVTALAGVLGYRLYSKRKQDRDTTDFAASLDETAIDHGRVGAA